MYEVTMARDANKTVLLRCTDQTTQKTTWENVGARLAGVDGNQLIVKVDGKTLRIIRECCRILEPRPQPR